MASPNINIWFRVDITLKHLQDQTSKVITVTSRPLRGENPHETFAILDSIDGLGLAAGQSGMPTSSTGSITLTDTFESFGAERRFFDLLERYTPIEQIVQVYAAQTALNDNAAYSDFVSVWKGKCKSVSRSGNLTLDVESQIFDARYVTKKITDTFVYSATTYNPMDKSIGKNLPLIFGDYIEIPAYPLSDYDDDSHLAIYGYGAQLNSTFNLGSINSVYIKDHNGLYSQISSPTTATDPYTPSIGGMGTGANYPTPQGLTERGVDFYGFAALITSGRWWFKGQNNGGITPTGNIIFNLYVSELGTYEMDTKPFARASVSKSDYLANVRGSSDFWVDFYWDKPVVLGPNATAKIIRMSMVLDNYDTALTDFVDGGVNSTTKPCASMLSNNQWSYNSSTTAPFGELFGVYNSSSLTLTEDSPDSAGLKTRILNMEQRSISGTPPDITSLDLILNTQGLKDDSGGNITGTPSQLITYPHHILKLMGYIWNGSSWVDSGNYDFSQFSSLYSSTFTAGQTYSRFISGATEGEKTLEEFLSDLMSQSASQLVQLTNGKLTIWPWGTTQAVTKVFSDEKTRVTNWRRLDSSSIINQIKIAYGKTLINAAENDLGVGGNSSNYSSILDWTVTSYPLVNMLIEDSIALYGKKPPQETELNLINDATSAETYGYSLLRQFDHPHTLAETSVDFWQNKDLELMQIIELVNPIMPSYLGSSTRAKLPSYDGSDVQVSQGDYWKRATRYRCQIISRVLSWSRSTLPSLVLGFRVVSPYHLNDPT